MDAAAAGGLRRLVGELVDLVGDKPDPKRLESNSKNDKPALKGSGIVASAYKTKARITRMSDEESAGMTTRFEKGTTGRLLERGNIKTAKSADDIPMDQHFKDF